MSCEAFTRNFLKCNPSRGHFFECKFKMKPITLQFFPPRQTLRCRLGLFGRALREAKHFFIEYRLWCLRLHIQPFGVSFRRLSIPSSPPSWKKILWVNFPAHLSQHADLPSWNPPPPFIPLLINLVLYLKRVVFVHRLPPPHYLNTNFTLRLLLRDVRNERVPRSILISFSFFRIDRSTPCEGDGDGERETDVEMDIDLSRGGGGWKKKGKDIFWVERSARITEASRVDQIRFCRLCMRHLFLPAWRQSWENERELSSGPFFLGGAGGGWQLSCQLFRPSAQEAPNSPRRCFGMTRHVARDLDWLCALIQSSDTEKEAFARLSEESWLVG